MIHHTYVRTPEGARIELRAFGASVGASVTGTTAWGAYVFGHPQSRAGGVGVHAGTRLVGLYGALRPVRWVDGGWAAWVPAMFDAASRCVSVMGNRNEVEWRLWVPLRPHDPRRVNTPREGFASWARVVLGRLHSRQVSRRKRPIAVTMPEGTYHGDATRTVTETTRDRWPFPKRSTEVYVSLSPVGVVVPETYPKGSVGYLAGRTTSEVFSHASDLDSVAEAVAEFAASLTAKRAGWVPPRRFRPAETGEALEERNPTTGVWSLTDVTRATIPATSMVEQRGSWALEPSAMLPVMGIGSIAMLSGLLGYVGGASARADRR